MYFYNGAGIGAGDFNKDGLTDLFFASNQRENKIYLNKGGMQFSDATQQAKIPQDGGWSTGVSVVDINNDGLLDIYVCRVGQYEILNSRNQLLICKGINKEGIPFYEDQAKQWGIDFSGFSTQAAFFDYDLDGDLDVFLLNHSVHQDGSFGPRANFLGTYHPLSGDRLFRNEGNRFTDVTRESGINSSAISYGLGVVVADINLDGWPDLYTGNDFHENDYLYINQRNGTFTEENNQRLMHTSKFSMGVDAADINNDGAPEIISMDMLPADPYILKRSLGDDDYDIFYQKIQAGYNYQYSRNNLQFNRGNGLFSEVGLYSGIYATDWSWAPLFLDFDNDGLKDLFISNGIPKRLNDMDYVNFISNEQIQQQLRQNRIDERNMALVKKFPEIKIPNKFYHNNGQLSFSDLELLIANDQPTCSNGAVYADLDNDGDLDLVVNNIDDNALVYQNKSNDKGSRAFVSLELAGPPMNRNALGAKVVLFTQGGVHTYENYPVKGFQSSMQEPLHIGLDKVITDSAFLIWPDNTYQSFKFTAGRKMKLEYRASLPLFDYTLLLGVQPSPPFIVRDITGVTAFNHVHHENHFAEFNREPLLPHMLSTEGPALAIADINGDSMEDIFIGGAKSFPGQIYLQQAGGSFLRTVQPALDLDSMYEDVDACWTDVNNDQLPDLVIASGGNEYYGTDPRLQPRVYINKGKAVFEKITDAFPPMPMTASTVAADDFNGDGAMDLFIGGRALPWAYGETPPSYLLQNDGKGKFTDVTARLAKDLSRVGMVTGAVWFDLDQDGDRDLLLCCEWGGILAFMNNKAGFEKKILTEKKGWWNFILPVDADGDGDTDLLAGNLGLNSRLMASSAEPVRMYYNDFDENGKKEQVLTYYMNGKEIPFANKEELQKQMPSLKKKFLYAGDFAKSSLDQIFSPDKLRQASVLEADYFSNSILLNQGNLEFTVQSLPWQAQLSSYRDAFPLQGQSGQPPVILLVGNYYDNNIQMGRYDADFGTLLYYQKGKGLICENFNGSIISGQVRHIRPIRIGQEASYILARNNDSTRIIRLIPRDSINASPNANYRVPGAGQSPATGKVSQ